MALDDHGIEHSSSCSRSNRRRVYDVFLSFRGEDTRKGFTDHLYDCLRRNGLKTFRDEEELERGEVIKPSLLQAIEESSSAIVVLSKNYATSTWCLDELQWILHSKKMLCLHVFPIFYGVDTSDVRHQARSFAEAFAKHDQIFAHNKMKVQRWKDDLKEVADLAGWTSENWKEAELVQSVAERVWSKLNDETPFEFNDNAFVGIDKKISEFNSLLANTLEEVQFIGIWGMGGLGKTTLASAVYERIHRNYDVHVFLQNVREESSKDGGLISLQQKLLHHWTNMEVDNCYEGRKLIKRRLCNIKVLVVLDDVSDISQLENLAGDKGWFGQGSTIIITTRDKHHLVLHGVVSQYEMTFLTHDESLQLFIQTAFKGAEPNEGFLELSEMAIKSAKNLPLAIRVFGSFLCGRNIPEWEDALKKIPSSYGIFDTLKVSFDGLECNEKTIFLDIACFFNGMDKDYVMQILENIGLYPKIGIEVLIEKSLVTESEKSLRVHDMLEEMGKDIVRYESPDDANKRSRIWSLEDANRVLRNKRGTETIRGIVVRFDEPYVIHFDREAFSSMSNLKLLIIKLSHCQLNLCHGLSCLSDTLKVIEWEWYPLHFLPSQTQLDELVDIKMQHSKLKELWRGDQFLQSLKYIDLSHSTNLIRTPNFDKTPYLQRLILEGCTKLIDVHHSIGQHKNLVIVDFKGCRSIKTLPTKFEMDCLETLVLSGCLKIKKLPEFGKGMERLSRLDLNETAISKLPQSLVNLIGLANLNLKNCKNLVCLPHDFQKLKAMKDINVAGCSKFSRLPVNLNENEALEVLDVSGTAISKLPPSLVNLIGLANLNLKNCKNLVCLPHDFQKLKAMKNINIAGCSKFSRLPDNLNENEALEVLDVCGTAIKEVPSLPSLKELSLGGCNGYAQSLSSWNYRSLLKRAFKLRGPSCSTTFLWSPTSFSNLSSSLVKLNLSYCNLYDGSLSNIGIDNLSSLTQLDLSGNNFVEFPSGVISKLRNLYYLCLNDCRRLQSLPQLPANLYRMHANACPSSKYYFQCESDDSCYQWKYHILSNCTIVDDPEERDLFMHLDRVLVISGSQVPSWFHNQDYFFEGPYPPGILSFMVNKPDSCSSYEWWGLVVCLVLENNLEYANPGELYIVAVEEYRLRYSIYRVVKPVVCRHQLCIMRFHFRSHVKEKLKIAFHVNDSSGRRSCKMVKGGWRVLCKEDVERWRNTRDEGCSVSRNDDFVVEEDDVGITASRELSEGD